MASKITVIGAGSVGATIAYTLSQETFASEIVIIDINKEKVDSREERSTKRNNKERGRT